MIILFQFDDIYFNFAYLLFRLMGRWNCSVVLILWFWNHHTESIRYLCLTEKQSFHTAQISLDNPLPPKTGEHSWGTSPPCFLPKNTAGESLWVFCTTNALCSTYIWIPCQGPDCTNSLNCPGHPDLAPRLHTLSMGLGSLFQLKPKSQAFSVMLGCD